MSVCRSLAGSIGLVALALIASTARAEAPDQKEPAPVLTEDMRDAFDRDCADDNGTDRCDADVQAKMLAMYGWDDARDLLGQGVQFRRFMMVDGYGRDVLGLTMARRPDEGPRVVVDVPKKDKSRTRTHPDNSLTADLTEARWKKVLSVTQQLEAEPRTPMNVDEDGNTIIRICVHSWFTVFEAGEPGKGDKSSSLRIKSEGACADGPAMTASMTLADIAFDALPECHGLDQEWFRNTVMLLNTCRQLGGDRLAASEARGLTERLDHALDSEEAEAVASLFSSAKQKLAAAFQRDIENATLYLEPPFAEENRAKVSGLFVPKDQPSDDSGSYLAGEIELDLIRGSEGWRIVAYTLDEPTSRKYQ